LRKKHRIAVEKYRIFENGFLEAVNVTQKKRFQYLRILLLYYRYWLSVDEIARRFNYTPRYVQKVLYRSDIKPYAHHLTNG
jgi:hypothetical protein